MPDQISRERSTTLLFYACIFLLGYLVYLLLRPFLTPLAWAAIFAAFFYKKHKKIEARLGKTAAASIGTAAVTLIIVVPFVMIGFAFIQEASQTIRAINLSEGSSKGRARLQVAWSWLQRQSFGRNLGPLDQYIRQGAQHAAGIIAEPSADPARARDLRGSPRKPQCYAESRGALDPRGRLGLRRSRSAPRRDPWPPRGPACRDGRVARRDPPDRRRSHGPSANRSSYQVPRFILSGCPSTGVA